MNIKEYIKINNIKEKFSASYVYIIITCMCVLGLILYNFIEPGAAVWKIGYVDRNDTTMDFFNTVAASNNYTLREIFTDKIELVTYPPVATVFFWVYSRFLTEYVVDHNPSGFELRDNQFALYPFLLLWIFMMIWTYDLVMNKKEGTHIEKQWFALSCVLSYGFLTGIERGNAIMLCPMLVLAFLSWYDSSNKVLREIGLIALALAAGMKIYPAIFGVLLLTEKKYREAIRTIIYGAIAMFGFPLYYGGFTPVVTWLGNLVSYTEVNDPTYNLAGCSFRLTIKSILVLFGFDKAILDNAQSMATTVGYIILIVGILFCFKTDKLWKKITLLSCVSIQAFSLSFDYCYSFMIFPMIYLCNEDPKLEKRDSKIAFILLCLILVPFILPDVITFPYQQSGFDVTRLVKQIALLILEFYLIYDAGKAIFIDVVSKLISKWERPLATILSISLILIMFSPIVYTVKRDTDYLNANSDCILIGRLSDGNGSSLVHSLYLVDDSLRESLQYFYHIPDKNFIDSSSVEGMRKMAEWTKSLIVDEDVYWQLCNVYDGDAMYIWENGMDGDRALVKREKNFCLYGSNK